MRNIGDQCLAIVIELLNLNGEQFLLIVSREIEERRLLQEKLEKMAFHDELTQLPNRRLFQDRMQQTLKEAKRNNRKFALLYMDIDKFK